jgi:glycosyltransferase involved in cell wall biosynthesis
VISFHPLAAGFAPATWARSVTYYARDDWAALPAYRPWWSVCRESYDRIRSQGRGVVAVSQVLLERLAPTGPSAVLANGIDADEWADPGPPPPWFAELPGPRFVYVGTLDDRLDLGAIEALAAGYPGGSIVLMGPMPAGSPLESWRRPNVHIVTSRGRPEVVSVVHAADACLLTHRTTSLTEAMSPLKLYEYLAGGRPVVATDLGPVRGVDRRVVLVDGDDVVGAAERALALGPASESERAAFVVANSWAERHRQVMELAFR